MLIKLCHQILSRLSHGKLRYMPMCVCVCLCVCFNLLKALLLILRLAS